MRTFFIVAKSGSFSQAATKLFISQSAVSHAMKKLQHQCGHQLFQRKGHALSLTAAGKVLFSSADKMFHALKEAEKAMDSLCEQQGGTLRLGATVEFGSTVLMKYLKPFLDRHPKITVDVICEPNGFPLLLQDDIDLMIDCQVHHHPQVQRDYLFREAYAVIASPDFLDTHSVSRPADLAHIPILSIDKEGFWWSNFLNALPTEERADFSTIIQINHIRGIINAVLSEMGIGLVPKYSVLTELHTGKLIQLFPSYEHFDNSFYIYYKRRLVSDSRVYQLIEYFQQLNPIEFH